VDRVVRKFPVFIEPKVSIPYSRPSPRLYSTFCNMSVFYDEELFASCQTPRLEDHLRYFKKMLVKGRHGGDDVCSS
jgi:hypothetical protein